MATMIKYVGINDNNEKVQRMTEDARLEREAYVKTPEYRVERAKELKLITHQERVIKDIIQVEQKTHLRYKDKDAANKWRKFIKDNADKKYNKAVIRYAKRWAKYMQHLMKKHNKTVDEIADQTMFLCNLELVPGYVYMHAINALSECWKYGDELLRWYNEEDDNEDAESVMNPTVISFRVG